MMGAMPRGAAILSVIALVSEGIGLYLATTGLVKTQRRFARNPRPRSWTKEHIDPVYDEVVRLQAITEGPLKFRVALVGAQLAAIWASATEATDSLFSPEERAVAAVKQREAAEGAKTEIQGLLQAISRFDT
jgi:hypothetical protein